MMKTDSTLGSQPAFYLLYLVFYFIPWAFSPPGAKDIVAIVIALLVFLPLYFHAAQQQGHGALPHALLMSVLSIVIAPFHGAHGVFHIYAISQAGMLRPERSAWLTVFLVSSIFLVFSMLTNQNFWDAVFPLFMGFMIAAGVITASGQIEKQKLLQRSNLLDKQMATQVERERIAQDLHDILGQTLTMVTLKTELATKLVDSEPDQAKKELDDVLQASRSALEDIRHTVYDMNVTSVVKELQRAEAILESAGVKFDTSGKMPGLETTTDHVLGLVIREAITNIVRHADANHARLSWEDLEHSIKLVIRDNGSSHEVSEISEGAGLKGMRRRLEKIGGQLVVSSESGMRLLVEVPKA